jgi:predicted permease
MNLWQDIRFGARVLIKGRWFTLAAVSALALGLAGNTAVFTFVNTALLRGLPFEDPHQIVTVGSRDTRSRQRGVSIADFEDWRTARSFETMTLVTFAALTLSDDSGQQADRYDGFRVYSNIFQVIRQQPVIGRNFTAADDVVGSEAVVMLGYGIWQTRYARDPSIIGKTLNVGGAPARVIGVMPPDMKFPPNSDLWVLFAHMAPELRNRRRDARNYQVIGRLRPGATVEQAQAELSGIGAALAEQYPDTNKDWSPWVRTWNETVNGPQIRLVFWSLMGAVAFVLLIACANVANLLLARAAYRSQEVSVRVSLGATRWQLVQQLLVESLILALVSGVVGLVLAVLCIRAFEAALPEGRPYYWAFTLDPVVFLFLAVVSLVTAVIFGLAPALHISRTNVNDVLKEGGRAGGSVRARRWTSGLIVGELALTLALLAGAGFMMRSFMTLYRLDVGVDTSNLITMRLVLNIGKYPTPESLAAFLQRLEERIPAIPEIEAGAVTTNPPLGGAVAFPIAIEGRPVPAGETPRPVGFVGVGPRYFEALRVRLMRGRSLTETDGQPGQENVVVNQQFVAMVMPGEDPVGQRLRVVVDTTGAAPVGSTGKVWTIVGVVPNVRQRGFDRDPDPVVYTPLSTPFLGFATRLPSLVVRTRAGIGATTARLRKEVQNLDPSMPVFSIQTMDALIAQPRWPFRVFGSMFVIFAGIALLLSAIGLYAVTSYSVTQRTREIGVRMALGAQSPHVLWLFGRRAIAHLSLGVALGLAGAVGVGRLLQSLLVQSSSTDPLTLVLIAVVLVAVGLTASLWPARRASRIDPVVALRYE